MVPKIITIIITLSRKNTMKNKKQNQCHIPPEQMPTTTEKTHRFNKCFLYIEKKRKNRNKKGLSRP